MRIIVTIIIACFSLLSYSQTILTEVLFSKKNTEAGWLSSFNYRRTITINNYQVEKTLTNYQVRIRIDSTNFDYSHAKLDGGDIRFTSSNGTTLLNYYIEKYNQSPKISYVWVKFPTIPSSGQITCYLYYGNSSASSASNYDNTMSKFVTDTSTLALWHCDDKAGSSVFDYSGNGKNLTLRNGVTWDSQDGGNFGNSNPAVKFSEGSSLIFNGANYAIDTLHANISEGTLELWFNKNSSSQTTGSRLFHLRSTTTNDFIEAQIYNGINVRTYSQTSGITSQITTLTQNVWYHLAVTWGSKGINIFLNGVLQGNLPDGWHFDNKTCNLIMGSGYNSGYTAFFNGKISEIRFLKYQLTESEVYCDFYRQKTLQNKYLEQDKFIKLATNPILSPTQVWESSAIYEPSVIYDGGIFKMWYSGGWGSMAETGYATSTDGINWIKPLTVPVVGNNHGGESGVSCRNSVMKYNGTYYMYYANGTGLEGDVICLATSTDGINFTKYGTVIPVGSSGSWDRYNANTCAWVENGTFYMLYESGGPGTAFWKTGLATSSDGYTWTKYESNPLTTMQIQNGMYGGPNVHKIGSTYHNFHHASTVGNSPTYLYDHISTDLHTWSLNSLAPILGISQNEGDQIADPCVVEANGKTYIYYDGTNNFTSIATIRVAIYNGTLAQLVTDTQLTQTITIGSETTQ